MVGRLISVDDVPAFSAVKDVRLKDIGPELRAAVRQLHEADDLEEFIRAILSDRAATPHGPAEIVDILTHRILIEGTDGLAAFILKGRSFRTVRPKDVSHQIYRLEKIDGLTFAAFGATGTVLDAAKEQFTSTCRRLGLFYSILDVDDFARLLWAFGFLCPRDGTRIVGGRCDCGYTPSHAVMNVLQEEALNELRQAHKLGQTKALVVLPPGSGKTRIAAKDAHAFGAKRVLYVAHTHEILDVAEAEFSAAYGAEKVFRASETGIRPSQPVTLATIQHLDRHPRQPNIDYLIVDEFHHAAAASYRRFVGESKHKFLLGLTATPFRGDRQDISSLCDGNIVVNYELRSAVDMGILSPYHYYGCFDDIDYSNLPLTAGKYSIRDLERRLVIKERHQAIVTKWRARAVDKPTLAFCCSHKHAEKVAAEFSAQGIKAATYLSHTDAALRRQLIVDMKTGKLRVLCVVDVLNEGADMPFVECLMFVRPTESKRIFLQQLGRGLRRYVGKTHCVVIDFIGNFRNAFRIVDYHGLRSEDVDHVASNMNRANNVKEVLDLPLGCKVVFEDKVLDIFASQTLHPRNATRHNIGRILLYQYDRISRRLGHPATRRELDRQALLDARLYDSVFGSWAKFVKLRSGVSAE
jgi:superfamily II DNA or RNA helicase